MNRARIVAALAALLTALLLQGALVGPLTLPLPVSLPALLVAAVALVDGPGAGLALGFATGLIADLSSDHPAGIFALCWLAVGLACGAARSPGVSVRRDAAVAAAACACAGVLATTVLAVLGDEGASVLQALRDGVPVLLVDALLALVIVPVVRFFLRSRALRAPEPVLLLGGRR